MIHEALWSKDKMAKTFGLEQRDVRSQHADVLVGVEVAHLDPAFEDCERRCDPPRLQHNIFSPVPVDLVMVSVDAEPPNDVWHIGYDLYSSRGECIGPSFTHFRG
jgi:hypothetical protein